MKIKYKYCFLAIVLALVSCQSAKKQTDDMVRFDNIWNSPFRVSKTYCHQLENEEGQYLYILNKTAWAYFVCEYPEKVLENVKKHGANVIRVCLEGKPYEKELGYDLWPWLGTRSNPDFSGFNESFWDEVERRIILAGENGIGIDLVLYFDLVPSVADFEVHKPYLDRIVKRLSKYSNILAWEIMNEEISNEAFQDSVGVYLKKHDPNLHPVISSDGTTDDALWPHKSWMDLAIVHTCTGNQDRYDLEHWYLQIAKNIRQYGKPAFNNETGRENRHKNDDPVHRRKQAWLFSNSGCFWTWHSWDGCEGINDTTYFAPGWEYLKPMKAYYESADFWKLEQNNTVCATRQENIIHTTLSAPDRHLTVMYCCTRENAENVQNAKAYLRIKDGMYRIRFIHPSDLELIGEVELKSEGLRNEYTITLPDFTDDLLVEITETEAKEKSLIEGTL